MCNELDKLINKFANEKLWYNICLIKCVTCFLISGSKKATMQFQIVFGMISKAKITRHMRSCSKDLIIQICNFIKKRLHDSVFLWLLRNFKDTYFEKDLQTATSQYLSHAAILTFRRYFKSSSLSAFYKIGVLKTSMKFLRKHICRNLFLIKLQTFNLKFY